MNFIQFFGCLNSFVPALLLTALFHGNTRAQDTRPDIVLIIVDDLNDWVGCLSGHPKARSPNIDALANKGMLFSQAYCNAPQCRPSRTSLNSGIFPYKTGIYFNARYPRERKITSPTLQQFFSQEGYRVASGGKVFHGNPGKHGDALFNRPRDPKPPKGKDKFNAMKAPNDGYPLDVPDHTMGDYKVATWAIQQWKTKSEKPLFMSVGFFRPHRPLQVPQPWFKPFPLASIQRPAEPKGEDDWADLPDFAKRLARTHAHKPLHQGLSDHEYLVKNKQWNATIQAYQAS
ncbi:MAG: sulfatase-like hydrolase/transferase, partial [Planctomycetota bacterium]|nr:sulfatase-like hydrolase/transferase [Planctomycetota bacterium]